MKYLQRQNPDFQKKFRCGILLPDAAEKSDKERTHFRDPQKRGNVIVVPELDRFLHQNPINPSDPIACGYYAHLHLDREFFSDYLKRYVVFFNADGKECMEAAKIVSARLTGTGKEISVKEFFSENYLYGDYTKLNLILIDRFQLKLPQEADLPEGSYCGVAYRRLVPELKKLEGFIESSRNCDRTLNVFEEDTLIQFLDECAHQTIKILSGGNT